jgi:hypothetical protein
LDRIDSSKGHVDENCVACCFQCNIAKLDYSLEEFLIHIEKMYEGTKELREQIILSKDNLLEK